jgi:uncharacterized protein (UPF0332 family)
VTSDPNRAAVCWRKAEAHLREASAQNPDASPMAVINSSYFAMFHVARAVLFHTAGRAPKRHDEVIQQFGLLVRNLDEPLRAAGRAFNEIRDERTAADYDETVVSSPEDAKDALQAARKCLALCGARYRMRRSSP